MSADARMQEAERWWSAMRGEDAERMREAFDAWHADPLNAAAYARHENTWGVAAGLGSTTIGRGRDLSRVKRSHSWATAPRLAAAAALLIAIVIGVAFFPFGGTGAPGMATAHATDIGEVRTLQLADGTTVTLDTDSRVEVSFDSKERRVKLLRGRARFDVRTEAGRGFVVEAGGKLVTARDADFDAELAPQGLSLSALRGALDVRAVVPAIATAAQLRVEPGQSVRFDEGGAAQAQSPIAKGSEQWVAGMLVFHGTPLPAVLEQTNRYTRHPIRLGDGSLASLKVTGTFRPLPVEQLAESLAAAFNLEVRKGADGSLLLLRR